jgi:hypothetical protein
MGNPVTSWVIGVVVRVVRIRVHSSRRACDLESVVDHKCYVVFLEEVLSSSFLSPVLRDLDMKSE